MSNPVQKRVADWANAHPDFYQNGHVAMQVDEPSLRETMLAFFADGWRYMLIGAALASAGVCAGLALYLNNYF